MPPPAREIADNSGYHRGGDALLDWLRRYYGRSVTRQECDSARVGRVGSASCTEFCKNNKSALNFLCRGFLIAINGRHHTWAGFVTAGLWRPDRNRLSDLILTAILRLGGRFPATQWRPQQRV